MDADFSHPPKKLLELRQACLDGGRCGYRLALRLGCQRGKLAYGTRHYVYYASAYVRIVTGMNVRDTTAGFVCYRRNVLEAIDLAKSASRATRSRLR